MTDDKAPSASADPDGIAPILAEINALLAAQGTIVPVLNDEMLPASYVRVIARSIKAKLGQLPRGAGPRPELEAALRASPKASDTGERIALCNAVRQWLEDPGGHRCGWTDHAADLLSVIDQQDAEIAVLRASLGLEKEKNQMPLARGAAQADSQPFQSSAVDGKGDASTPPPEKIPDWILELASLSDAAVNEGDPALIGAFVTSAIAYVEAVRDNR